MIECLEDDFTRTRQMQYEYKACASMAMVVLSILILEVDESATSRADRCADLEKSGQKKKRKDERLTRTIRVCNQPPTREKSHFLHLSPSTHMSQNR